jgi:hypothetical protein
MLSLIPFLPPKSRERIPLIEHTLHPMSVDIPMVGSRVCMALHDLTETQNCTGHLSAPRPTIHFACILLSFQGAEHSIQPLG